MRAESRCVCYFCSSVTAIGVPRQILVTFPVPNFVKVLSRFSRYYTWTYGGKCRYSNTNGKRHSSTYYCCDPPQLLRLVIY